ncbi:hypothetical protein ACFE04_015725 [Oxalis oulophora]
MMYMGTPRDYEYYVATRVMIRSLVKLQVQADLVIIASKDVPLLWLRAMEDDDGARVVLVENLDNPYRNQANFDKRFKLTLNKLYAWSLTDYDRVVMLDSDNLFLGKTDELFQCGQFCAVFINPCIFHTGLFVLQPSMDVFKDMLHQLDIGKDNPDGADQGFIAPWLKPWFWWAWPVLPLGLDWHEQRREILGYDAEMPMIFIQAIVYIGIIAVTRLARPSISKLCYRRADKNITMLQTSLKILAMWMIFAAYVIPFFIIPHTIHPVTGWALYLLGSFALCCVAINTFLLPMLPVLCPWIGFSGCLVVMGYPWYSDGVVRALSVFGYAFCAAPFLWVSIVRIRNSLQVTLERENFFPRLGESSPPSEFNKLY